MHFCVALPGSSHGQLLLNVSRTSQVREGEVVSVPRFIALLERDGWRGRLDTGEAEDVRESSSGIDFAVGGNRISWRSGSFHVSLGAPDFEVELALTPRTLPTFPTSVSLGGARSLYWVAIPRVEAPGAVRVGGERFGLDGALGYHDHNWGLFEWGKDLSWVWGYLHPRDARNPWTVVIARVSDASGERTLARSALLWKGPHLVRAFQSREVSLQTSGRHVRARPFTLPPIAQLLLPDFSAEVPERCHVSASGAEDSLDVRFEARSRARIAVPSDVDPFGLMILDEVCGDAQVRGSVGSELFEFTGPAMMEFARA